MKPTLSFIGCGHLGKTLGRLWADAGTVVIQDVLTQSAASAQNAVAYIGAGSAANNYADLRPADIYLMATSDDSIASACEALVRTSRVRQGSVVFHCSGALPSSVLNAASRRGATVASVHPIRSFASPDDVVKDFTGTWCGVEGDDAALALLVPIFEAIGAKTARIEAAEKILYHAAAVFAANYTTTLLAVAQDAYVAAGIAPDTALQLMEPLVRASIDNVFRLGPAAALSGPAARGDTATVEKQQATVSAWQPKYGEAYRQLAALATELAARRKSNC
jgi:predicted short-subunit dehydrogenase-like oxidoreductase (DUF2520 family)